MRIRLAFHRWQNAFSAAGGLAALKTHKPPAADQQAATDPGSLYNGNAPPALLETPLISRLSNCTMRRQLTEFILKGIYLGLLVFVGLQVSQTDMWPDIGRVALCTFGGLLLFLGVAAVRNCARAIAFAADCCRFYCSCCSKIRCWSTPACCSAWPAALLDHQGSQ